MYKLTNGGSVDFRSVNLLRKFNRLFSFAENGTREHLSINIGKDFRIIFSDKAFGCVDIQVGMLSQASGLLGNCWNKSNSGEGDYVFESELLMAKGTTTIDSSLRQFAAGRTTLRRAISAASESLVSKSMMHCIRDTSRRPIMRTSSGAPLLCPSIFGSLSHKNDLAAAGAVVLPHHCSRCTRKLHCMEELEEVSSRCPATPIQFELGNILGLGIDIELCRSNSKLQSTPCRANRLQTRILTDNEIKNIGRTPNMSSVEETLLLFSLKESVFKALHQNAGRHIGFKEIEISFGQIISDGASSHKKSAATFKALSSDLMHFKLYGEFWKLTVPVDETRRFDDYWLTAVIAVNADK